MFLVNLVKKFWFSSCGMLLRPAKFCMVSLDNFGLNNFELVCSKLPEPCAISFKLNTVLSCLNFGELSPACELSASNFPWTWPGICFWTQAGPNNSFIVFFVCLKICDLGWREEKCGVSCLFILWTKVDYVNQLFFT